MPHSWHVVQGTPTAAQSVENWQDHIGWVEQLYAGITGNDDPEFLRQMNDNAVMFFPPDSEAQQQAHAGTYSDPTTGEAVPHGFSIQTGGPNEAFICLFDHDVYNPWRPGTQGSLDEDLSNTVFVRIPRITALGMMGVHGSNPDCYQDTSLPSAQRMFVQVFLERLYHEYTGAEDKVWTFGWMERLFNIYPTGSVSSAASGPDPAKPRYAFREEVQGMVDWLNERFIGRTTTNGNPVARYATMTGVRDEFLAWEADHPGVSSFELNQYTFQRCPSSLRDKTQGYWAYESDGTIGCYDSVSNRGEPTGNPLSTTTVYVAWQDAAEPEPTDMTVYVGRYATAYDGVSGDFLGADDALNALPLAVTQNQEADPLTKLQFWTYKPAVFAPG